ncbi:MAG TPA: amidohydrolase family protein [Solirubrobacteraceae bacterium]|jgi:hypothetical protein|nr:amidohydrolase family protein [Solirubrobacteraceae bacterium]
MKTDIHQHLWTGALVEALARRSEHPFVRDEHGLTVLFLAGERPYVIDLDSEDGARRAELARRDGLDRTLVCLSSPLGIESLPRQDATELIDAYHDGALALGEPFGVWGALALERLDPDDVDRALERGCVGISLPAGALGSIDTLTRLSPVLGRIQEHGVPLFVHPGPGTRLPTHEATLGDPLWWPALTRYVAEVHAAWFVFVTAARRQFPELRVVFAMLAGLAPLHTERLLARGGPAIGVEDPLIFYDTSSNGPQAISLMERLVGSEQLLYGSDRPVVDPDCHGIREALDWESLASNADRLLAREPQRAERPRDPEPRTERPQRQVEHPPRRRTERRPSVGTQRSEPTANPRPKRVAVLGRAVR